MDIDEGQPGSIKAGEIETFKKTHQTKNNKWIHKEAEKKYVCIIFPISYQYFIDYLHFI